MEINEKKRLMDDLTLYNNVNLIVDPDEVVNNEEINNKEVNFYSDLINGTIGELDITV